MTAETGLPMAAPSFVRKSIRYTGSMWILMRKSKSWRSVQALAWCGLQGLGRSLTKRSKNPTTTASRLPTRTRLTRCFRVGDYTKISVSTTKGRCRPGYTRNAPIRAVEKQLITAEHHAL